jgi:hypothetical protein
LYWLLKQKNVPRDVIYLIIGNNKRRKFHYYKEDRVFEGAIYSILDKDDIQAYYSWKSK